MFFFLYIYLSKSQQYIFRCIYGGHKTDEGLIDFINLGELNIPQKIINNIFLNFYLS